MTKIHSGQRHDHILFNQLVNDYSQMLYRLARKYHRDRLDQEDFVQEVFLRVFLNLNHLDVTNNFPGWIYRVGKNLCVDMIRSRNNRMKLTLSMAEDPDRIINQKASPAHTPEQQLLESERNEWLMGMINSLPYKWRSILYQRYILGMTMQEISHSHHIPVNTVKTRIHRALLHLRRRYGDRD